ncbi:MAG: hypothetical protein FWF27_00915, partial [Candidatus Bathyarchaeota archaeon]|nr:hypothetical protein [Candidatus Termiticorpusculum sp.]
KIKYHGVTVMKEKYCAIDRAVISYRKKVVCVADFDLFDSVSISDSVPHACVFLERGYETVKVWL